MFFIQIKTFYVMFNTLTARNFCGTKFIFFCISDLPVFFLAGWFWNNVFLKVTLYVFEKPDIFANKSTQCQQKLSKTKFSAFCFFKLNCIHRIFSGMRSTKDKKDEDWSTNDLVLLCKLTHNLVLILIIAILLQDMLKIGNSDSYVFKKNSLNNNDWIFEMICFVCYI